MTAFKVGTRFTPFKLIYWLEGVTPMEFIVPSFRVATLKKLSKKTYMVKRLII